MKFIKWAALIFVIAVAANWFLLYQNFKTNEGPDTNLAVISAKPEQGVDVPAIRVAEVTKLGGEPDQAEKQLRHVVMFKFKDGTTQAEIKKVEGAFRALPSKIKEIKEFEWGINNSPEKHSQGFTHCFFLTFADEKGREVYLPHPAHKEFGKVLGPHLDKVLVVDYWATK